MNRSARRIRPIDGLAAGVLLGVGLAACGTNEILFDAAMGAGDAAPPEQRVPSSGDSPDADAVAADVALETASSSVPLDDASGAGNDAAEPIDAPDAADFADSADSADAASAILGCSERDQPPYAPACTALSVSPTDVAASTAVAPQHAKNAFDGDTCTSWRSNGTPPQWIELALCSGTRCPSMPRIAKLGLYVERGASAPITVELQGATTTGRVTSAFHTMASASVVTFNGYAEFEVAKDAQPVMRVLVNSGPAAPVALREVVFLSCP